MFTHAEPAMGHGRTSTVHMRVQNGPIEVRQRAVTQVPTSPLSPRSPLNPGSPLLAQEECSERIDRLLQRVHRAQQSRREGIVRMEMTSPRTPTRLDPPVPLVLVQESATSSSTVSTASIRSDFSARDTRPEAFSPRRRAATMDPAGEKTPTARERFSFGRADNDRKPSDDMRAKIERVRARRAARLKDEMHESPVHSPVGESFEQAQLPRMRSEISGTTYYASDDDECDFFEMHDNLMLFREMEVPVKDVDWDKRVYYHHVARTNDAFRKAVEDVEIADCRESYVAELLGRREAADILRSDAGNLRADQSSLRADQSNFRADQSNLRTDQSNEHVDEAPHISRSEGMMAGEFAQPNQAEADAVLEWMDDESDVSSEGHSFDWTQHGFGYMEFRRRSRSSLASSSVLSPGEHTPRRGLSDLMANDQSRPISESPSIRPMDATRSGLEWSVSSSTARAATANFSEAVAAVGNVRQVLPGLAEVDESDSDDDWHMLDSGDLARPMTAAEEEAMAQEQLHELRSQNQELRVQVQHMFKAVASLTQVVIGAQ
ncbi:hypothetical protein EV180_000171 [Coemansia sp. RSA 518]|nr:hypothetical protein LPJ69_003406 [Coemansia sp. RSA 1752]KAJ2231737.1 hypothetical protein EV180_000171 [Coemansia sp. RSA 518]KAJ2293535.1 hypothetical protein IW141_001119 [Coemansia sp. RSA 355]